MNWRLLSRAQAEANTHEESWGSLRWLASEKLADTRGLTLGRVVIKSGKSNPWHSHPNSDEVLYLLRGRLEHWVGNETVLMEAGDTLVVPAGAAHHAVNASAEDADMIVAYNTGDRQVQPESHQPRGRPIPG